MNFNDIEVSNVIFFNHWRNGDSFINREYIKDVIRHFKGASLLYAHNNHPNVLLDLPVIQVPVTALPEGIFDYTPAAYASDPKTLFVNGWIGCHKGGHLPHNRHANFDLLYKAWGSIFNDFGIPLRSWEEYHPTVDYNVFDLTEADAYIQRIGDAPLVLFCNGQAMSGQSNMGNFASVLLRLAQQFPEHEFLATAKIGIEAPNITYTDDIFSSDVGNLHHIAYLSKRAKLIVGKNSGPFSFSHIKENMNDPTKTFVCFGHNSVDSLMGEGLYRCNSIFTSAVGENYAHLLLKEYIENPPYSSSLKETLVK